MKRLFCLYAKKDRVAVCALWSFPQNQFLTHMLPFRRACITTSICKQRFRLSSQSQHQFAIVTKLPPKLLTNTQQALTTVHFYKYQAPPHTFFFILRGSFSEPSPAQGTPVLLLLPVHQHKCMSRKASSLSFYFDLRYFVFPKALIVKLRPNGRLTWCEIYLFIMCHVYVLAFSFSL